MGPLFSPCFELAMRSPVESTLPAHIHTLPPVLSGSKQVAGQAHAASCWTRKLRVATVWPLLYTCHTSAFKPCSAVAAEAWPSKLCPLFPDSPLTRKPLNRRCLRAGGSDTAPGAAVAVPRYDKSAHSGRGDRAPPGKWPRVKGPLELVRSGFEPVLWASMVMQSPARAVQV